MKYVKLIARPNTWFKAGTEAFHEDPEWYWIPPNNPDGNGNPPNYCNDLNTMHRVEEGLTEKQQRFYQVWLMKIQKADYVVGCWFAIHATASQRAEAFVKTIGKWKE